MESSGNPSEGLPSELSTPGSTQLNGRRQYTYARLEAKIMANGPYYTVVLAFALTNLILFWHGVLLEAKLHHDFKRYTTVIARGCGYMLNMDVSLLLFVASRYIMTFLRSTPLNVFIPFDHAMPGAHITLGYVCFVAAALHGLFHIIPGLITHSWKSGFLKWTYAVCTGLFLFSVFSVMLFFARAKVRSTKFELFYYVHLVGALFFISILYIHGILLEKLYTFKWITPAVILYLLDRTFRKLCERRGYVRVTASGRVSFSQGNVFKLVIPKCMHYKAGQWAELCIPAISRMQWHPFTIASAPFEKNIVFFIKQAGDWTSQLGDLLCSNDDELEDDDISESRAKQIECWIRGPYGAPAQHVGQFDKVVLVAGGVGGTPFLSIVRDIVTYLDKRSVPPGDETQTHLDNEQHEEGPSTRRSSIFSRLVPGRKSNAAKTNVMKPSKISYLDMMGKTTVNVSRSNLQQGTRKPRPAAHVSDADNISEDSLLGDSSSDDESDANPAFVSIIEKTYFGLSSATCAYLVLWITICRFFLTLFAAILDGGIPMRYYNFLKVLPRGFQETDFALCLVVAVVSCCVICMDLHFRFDDITFAQKLFDTCIAVPVLITPVLFHIFHFSRLLKDRNMLYPLIFHYVLWPLTFLVVLFRHFRSDTGSAVLTSRVRNTYRNTRSLDFVYISQNALADDWLVEELEPHARSPYFRLHRFLTREQPDEEIGGGSVGRFANNYGRPDWNKLIENLVQNVRSGSSIGVFFCGPAQMELGVREACYLAMVRSRKRGMQYCNQSDNGNHMYLQRPQFGCNVRLMIRAEECPR